MQTQITCSRPASASGAALPSVNGGPSPWQAIALRSPATCADDVRNLVLRPKKLKAVLLVEAECAHIAFNSHGFKLCPRHRRATAASRWPQEERTLAPKGFLLGGSGTPTRPDALQTPHCSSSSSSCALLHTDVRDDQGVCKMARHTRHKAPASAVLNRGFLCAVSCQGRTHTYTHTRNHTHTHTHTHTRHEVCSSRNTGHKLLQRQVVAARITNIYTNLRYGCLQSENLLQKHHAAFTMTHKIKSTCSTPPLHLQPSL